MAARVVLLNPARRRGRKAKANPALVIVNGKRRNVMAVRRRRRKTTTTRRRRRAVANPRRRRATTRRVTHRRRRRAAPRVNRRRRHVLNPRRRRVTHRRRRRNPGLVGAAGGLLENAITAIVGMGLTNFAYGFVGSMNPAGMVGQIGIKLGIAIGLRVAANKFGFGKHANMLAIGGAVSAGQDALNYFVGGGGALFPAAAAAVPGRAAFPADTGMVSDGVGDIVYANPGLFNDVAYANPGLFN